MADNRAPQPAQQPQAAYRSAPARSGPSPILVAGVLAAGLVAYAAYSKGYLCQYHPALCPTVGDGGITTCQDPAATNYLGTLPCTYDDDVIPTYFNWTVKTRDSEFNMLPGARVVITNRDTQPGLTYEGYTDGNGEVTLSGIPGHYDLDITLSGWQDLHLPFINRSTPQYYSNTYQMYEPQDVLKSISFSRANAYMEIADCGRVGVFGDVPYKCCGTDNDCCEAFSWNIVQLLRDMGYTVPEGKVDVIGVTAVAKVGWGTGGIFDDVMTIRSYYDWTVTKPAGDNVVNDAYCGSPGNRTLTLQGYQDVQYFTVEGITGELKDVTGTLNVMFKE